MQKEIYLSSLYDIYHKLLTNQEQSIFESYYFDNLSLQEISENEAVSRNAIHKHLKKIEEKLNTFEECLKLKTKEEEILSLVEDESLKEKIEEILEK